MIDKSVSSVGATITALAVASLGYISAQPQPGDALTPALFWMTMFLWLGFPIIGYILTLIAMKWYPLDVDKMAEVRKHNEGIHAGARKKVNTEASTKISG
jgi:Na+/melibiose symporter-like transporter